MAGMATKRQEKDITRLQHSIAHMVESKLAAVAQAEASTREPKSQAA